MKKAFATITLATIMMFGSISSFAGTGIIISDKAEAAPCSESDGIIIFGRDGIIIFGVTIIGGCSSTDSTGIIISD